MSTRIIATYGAEFAHEFYTPAKYGWERSYERIRENRQSLKANSVRRQCGICKEERIMEKLEDGEFKFQLSLDLSLDRVKI